MCGTTSGTALQAISAWAVQPRERRGASAPRQRSSSRARTTSAPGRRRYLYAYIADDLRTAGSAASSGHASYVWKAVQPGEEPELGRREERVDSGRRSFRSRRPRTRSRRRSRPRRSSAGGRLPFVRLEDIAMQGRTSGDTYIADTGQAAGTGARARSPVRHNPQDGPTRGPTLSDPLRGRADTRTTCTTRTTWTPRNAGAHDPGGPRVGLRGGSGSRPPNPPVADARLRPRAGVQLPDRRARSVARVNTPAPHSAGQLGVVRHRRRVDRSATVGLLDVQAHGASRRSPARTLVIGSSDVREDGQLLAMFVPGSTGGGGRTVTTRREGRRRLTRRGVESPRARPSRMRAPSRRRPLRLRRRLDAPARCGDESVQAADELERVALLDELARARPARTRASRRRWANA